MASCLRCHGDGELPVDKDGNEVPIADRWFNRGTADPRIVKRVPCPRCGGKGRTAEPAPSTD